MSEFVCVYVSVCADVGVRVCVCRPASPSPRCACLCLCVQWSAPLSIPPTPPWLHPTLPPTQPPGSAPEPRPTPRPYLTPPHTSPIPHPAHHPRRVAFSTRTPISGPRPVSYGVSDRICSFRAPSLRIPDSRPQRVPQILSLQGRTQNCGSHCWG